MAPEFGWVPSFRFLLRRARVLPLVQSIKPGSLVEVGCGAGALLHELASNHVDAVGVETSASARRVAHAIACARNGKQTVVEHPDATWLSSKDIVCAFDVLEHIEDDEAAIRQWASWLRPGGVMCISVPAHRKRWGAGDEWAGHWRRYDRRDLLALIEGNSLILEHIECYGFPLGNFTEWYGERYYKRAIQERNGSITRCEATDDSGIDRGYYLKQFGRMQSVAGRLCIRVAVALQAIASMKDWGTGYLILARKP